MKTSRLLSLFVGFLLCTCAAPAADKPEPANSPTVEFDALVARIQAKLQQRAGTAEALAEELKAFDALIAKHQGNKTEEVARILIAEISLYLQVLRQPAKALPRLRQLRDEFPATEGGRFARQLVQDLERRAAAQNLVGRAAPELNFTWASRAGLKTLGALKGKVVVLDFWATWCGPCVASFPEMRELVDRYKDFPVEILGVTSIQGRVMGLDSGPIDTQGDPTKEMRLMADYIKARDITWPIVFSAEPVFNPDYGVEGIPHMVVVAPDGTVRHTNLDPRDPLADKSAKIDALLKEFKLKSP